MPNKEDILKMKLAPYSLKPEHLYHGTDVVKVCIERSMDEYAKQFGSWLAKEKFERINGETMRSSNWNSGMPYTINELYSQFIEQQTK